MSDKFYFYECAFCDKEISYSLKEFRDHVESNHFSGETKLPANASTNEPQNLPGENVSHEIMEPKNESEIEIKVFQCSDCEKKFRNEKKLIKHRDLVHLKTSTAFTCDICDYVTDMSIKLKAHSKIHRKCSFCHYISKSLTDIKKHYRESHNKEYEKVTPLNESNSTIFNDDAPKAEEPVFQSTSTPSSSREPPKEFRECSRCNFRTTSSHEMSQHFLRAHVENNAGQYYQQDPWQLHALQSFNESFPSQGGNFYYPSSVDSEARYHTSQDEISLGYGPFRCAFCGFEVSSVQELDQHVSFYHATPYQG